MLFPCRKSAIFRKRKGCSFISVFPHARVRSGSPGLAHVTRAQIKINKPIIGRAERRLRRFELTPRRGEVSLAGRDSIPRALPTGGHPSQFLFLHARRGVGYEQNAKENDAIRVCSRVTRGRGGISRLRAEQTSLARCAFSRP